MFFFITFKFILYEDVEMINAHIKSDPVLRDNSQKFPQEQFAANPDVIGHNEVPLHHVTLQRLQNEINKLIFKK